MTSDELKKKIAEELKKAMEPIEYGGDSEHPPEVHCLTEEEIADALIDAGLIFKIDYRKSRSAELARQERFAEEQGFTPDCSPYYIALQYKKRAETIRKETAQEIFGWFWHNLVNLNFITGNIEVNFAALQNFARTYGIELIEKTESRKEIKNDE